MTREEFWDRFDEVSKDLSCRKVAELVGMNWTTVARWRRRENAPAKALRQFFIEGIEKKRASTQAWDLACETIDGRRAPDD